MAGHPQTHPLAAARIQRRRSTPRRSLSSLCLCRAVVPSFPHLSALCPFQCRQHTLHQMGEWEGKRERRAQAASSAMAFPFSAPTPFPPGRRFLEAGVWRLTRSQKRLRANLHLIKRKTNFGLTYLRGNSETKQ